MSAPFTYSEVGASRSLLEEVPQGAHRFGWRRPLGGPDVFQTAADFVLGFGMQRESGIAVHATTPVAQVGTALSMRLRFGLLRISAPTRVVYVIDEPDRRGFAYGTLPGHPEAGEELFLVERVGNETWVEVRGFSRPARWYSRLGGPAVRLVQKWYAIRYLDAVSRAVEGG